MAKAVTITKDNVSKVFAQINALVGQQVLVGIPDNAQNKRDDEPVNNATVGYAMEFGMPEHNVPARPFLIPAVKKTRAQCLAQMKQAAEAALEGNATGVVESLHRAGIVAANEAKLIISDNIPPPLKPATIRNRYRQRDTKKRRQSEEDYLDAVAGGIDPGTAQYGIGITALINTGQMRNAITHVVRKKK